MSAAELSRFDDLVSRYLEETLRDSDAAELVALVAEPSRAARFVEMTRLNSEIAGLLAAPVPDAAMVELVRTDIERSLAEHSAPGRTRLQIVERAQPRAAAPMVSLPYRVRRKRKLPLRTAAMAAVFVVFIGLVALFLIKRTVLAAGPVVASAQGEVRLLGPKGEDVLKPGQSWQRGETLKTVGANSTATVTFRDGTRLDFGGNCVAVNQSTKKGCRVELEHGAVRGSLKKRPGGRPFVFATPEAEAVVVGTSLRLITGAHQTRLEVTEGEVRFRRRHDASEIAVKAGHYALVAPNVPLTARPIHNDLHHVQ